MTPAEGRFKPEYENIEHGNPRRYPAAMEHGRRNLSRTVSTVESRYRAPEEPTKLAWISSMVAHVDTEVR